MDQREPNKTTLAIRFAYEKGYRVSEDGVLRNPKGEIVEIINFYKYPKFTVHGIDLNPSRCFPVPVHRFAAYCFYGEEIFEDGLVVRHLNDNKMDVTKKNLALGSSKDNSLDIPYLVRKSRLDYARSFQGPPVNRKLTDADVREIRVRLSNGERCVDIAKDYSVVPRVVSSIKLGDRYKDVL